MSTAQTVAEIKASLTELWTYVTQNDTQGISGVVFESGVISGDCVYLDSTTNIWKRCIASTPGKDSFHGVALIVDDVPNYVYIFDTVISDDFRIYDDDTDTLLPTFTVGSNVYISTLHLGAYTHTVNDSPVGTALEVNQLLIASKLIYNTDSAINEIDTALTQSLVTFEDEFLEDATEYLSLKARLDALLSSDIETNTELATQYETLLNLIQGKSTGNITSVVFDGDVDDRDLVYKDLDTIYYRALNSGSTTNKVVGFADITNDLVIIKGLVQTDFDSYARGTPLYLSTSAAGKLTDTPTSIYIGIHLFSGIIALDITYSDSIIGLLEADSFRQIDTIQDLRDSNTHLISTEIDVLGHSSKNDNGGGKFFWDSSSTLTDNDISIIKEASAATGRWIRDNNKFYTLEMIGCVGDDATINSTEFKNLIDIASANGIEVVITEGVFIIGGVSIPSNLKMTGLGPNSILKLSDNSNANVLLIPDDIEDIILSNFKIDGNWIGQTAIETVHCIRINDAKNIDIDGLWLENANTEGIAVKKGNSDYADNVIIRNNKFKNCGRNGLAVLNGKNVKAYGNSFKQIGLIALDVEPNITNVVEGFQGWGNTADTSPWGGYALVGNGPDAIRSSKFFGNHYQNTKTKRTGSQTGNATATTGNIILDDTAALFQTWEIEVGDTLYRTLTGTIVGFRVVSVDSEIRLTIRRSYGSSTSMGNGDTYTFFGEFYGGRIWNADYSNFSNNTFKNLKKLGGTLTGDGVGIRTEGADFCTIIGNIIDNAEGDGIEFKNSSDNTFSCNAIIVDGYGYTADGALSKRNKINGDIIDATLGAFFKDSISSTTIVGPTTGSGITRMTGFDQVIPTGIETKVIFSTTSINPLVWFADSKFTPKQPGKYKITAAVDIDALDDGKILSMFIYKNGANYRTIGRVQASSTNLIQVGGSDIVDMDGDTDYIEIFCSHDLGVDANTIGGTVFTSEYIGW